MQNESTYVERISLPLLLAEALRKWMWLLAAILAGAVLLGLFGASRQTGGPSPALEAALEESQEALEAWEKNMETCQRNIANDNTKIQTYERILADQRQSREKVAALLPPLEEALASTQQTLRDPSLSPEAQAAAEEQLSALAKNILDAINWLNSTDRQIASSENDLVTWQQDIRNQEDRIEDLEEEKEELEKTLETRQEALDSASQPHFRFPFLYILFGGVLGMTVFGCVILLGTLAYPKIRSGAELEQRYGLPLLGEFLSDPAKTHSPFQRRLDTLAGDVQTLPEEAQVYALIAGGIQAAQPQPSRLAVAGTLPEEALQEVAGRLKALLPPAYEITVRPNPVYHGEVLTELSQFSLVLVEQKTVSPKREVAKLVRTLRQYHAPVVGMVVK